MLVPGYFSIILDLTGQRTSLQMEKVQRTEISARVRTD
jgi:hypothetical protein